MKGSLADLTNDLQRLQAEYANYRKRVDRDRQLVAESAAYKALTPVIEVLDTIDRAKEHGELEGGFKAVADQLERVVASAGLVRFGEPGDAFDPTFHEALSHLGADAEVRGHDGQARRQGRLPDGRPCRPRRPGARGRPGRRLSRHHAPDDPVDDGGRLIHG